jgi:sulfonate dioxygenase
MAPKHDDRSIPTVSPLFNPIIRNHSPPDPPHVERIPEPDRASFADPEKKALFSAASKVDNLTGSIGTELHGINLRELTPQQKDELALLVSEVRFLRSSTFSVFCPFRSLQLTQTAQTQRGVVFLRDQDLTIDEQVSFFEHYGKLDTHPAQADVKHVTISQNNFDHRDALRRHPWPLCALFPNPFPSCKD